MASSLTLHPLRLFEGALDSVPSGSHARHDHKDATFGRIIEFDELLSDEECRCGLTIAFFVGLTLAGFMSKRRRASGSSLSKMNILNIIVPTSAFLSRLLRWRSACGLVSGSIILICLHRPSFSLIFMVYFIGIVW